MDFGKHSPPWLSSSLVHAYDNSYGNKFDPGLFDKLEEPPPVHIIYPRPNPNTGESSYGSHTGEQLVFVTIFVQFYLLLVNS